MNAVIHPETGFAQEYRHLVKRDCKMVWYKSLSNELGRLAQVVVNRVSGSNTIFSIPKSQVAMDRRGTYWIIFCDIKPQKFETHVTKITVGGNIIDYPGEVTTLKAGITKDKILSNSTISTPDAIFMCAGIANFYFDTPMEHYKYMQLPFDIIPQEIIDEYNLTDITHKVKVYINIQKGVYGIPQALRISHDRF